MRNSLAGQLGALIVAASLMTSTSIAGVPQAQQQSAQQPSSQTSSQPQTGAPQGNTAPSQQPTTPPSGTPPSATPSSGTAAPGSAPSATTPSGTAQQGSAAADKQQGAVQQADQPIEQSSDPNVKAGSKADVSAIGNRSVGHGLNFYSLEHEIALGKQLSAEVERQAKFINDPVVNEYVNRVGQNLVRNSDAQVPFTIKVIDSDVVNAFALPGGFFYVNSGLILHADEESELAGVMAHEIAHVCARHGTK
ncbi:MAG: M48 family metalloprotease, partial [Candidatus Acidiferrales bacterium]